MPKIQAAIQGHKFEEGKNINKLNSGITKTQEVPKRLIRLIVFIY